MSKKKRRWSGQEDANLPPVTAGKPQAQPSPTKVAKLRHKKAGRPLRAIPNTVPFISPPATLSSGQLVPEQDWGNFSTRKQANYMLDQIRATVGAISGAIIVDLKVVDTTAIDGYILDVPLNPDKPKLSDIADFSIQGHVSVNGAANLFIDEWAGLDYSRIYVPDPESGDTNYQEVGWGADAIDVPVPGVLVAELLPSEDLIEFHWAKAA